MNPKLFTLNEANELLPRLKDELSELQRLTFRFEELYLELQHRKAEPRASGGEDPFFELEGRLEFLRIEAEMLIGNFERNGVLLKRVNPGLIDFPSILDGQDVLICWTEGEERASHYHGWHDGFAGRKPIPGGIDSL